MQQTFEQLFKQRNPAHVFLLARFQCAIDKPEVTFSDINTANLRRLREYMENEVAANSLRTYFAILKAFINECCNDGLIPSAKCLSSLKVKSTPQQNVALTEDEVRRLEAYYDRLFTTSGHQIEKDVLTLFFIELVCGARGIDVEQMSLSNIKDGKLSYVSRKTSILAVMPAHKRLALLLSRKPQRTYARMTKNRIIKRVCMHCGITQPVTLFYHGRMVTRKKYELVAFHTARRTFASILSAKGAPIAEIAQFMSHQNITMTERYIKVDTQQVSTAALSFFNE